MSKKLFVAMALLLIIGCGPDPVKIEKAAAIRRESEALYLATATHVAIREKANSVAIAATATAIADQEAIRAETQDDRIARQENIIWWSTIAAVVFLLAFATSLCVASAGGAIAFTQYVSLQAKLVWLNEATRTWPVMLDLKTGILVDLETGERSRLGDVSRVDHRRLIISGQARTVGLLAQAATQITKSTKSPQPGDMLAAIGQSVPLLEGEQKDP